MRRVTQLLLAGVLLVGCGGTELDNATTTVPATTTAPTTTEAPATTVAPTTTAAPTTTEGGLTPAEKAWIGTQIEEERRQGAEDGGLLDQIFDGPGLTEWEFGCVLRGLLDRWGLDDLRSVRAGYAPNPYSDMAEDYPRSFVEAIDACADLRKLIRGGVDSRIPIDVVDCWFGEVSDELVVEMTVITAEYELDPGSDGSELMQFTQQQFLPRLMKCAEELLSPEEFSELFTTTVAPATTVAPTTTAAPTTTVYESVGERNARKSAESYLEYSAFSRSGLIEQLVYEGFTTAEAEYGVDAQDADWNAQAALSAESYLEYSAFSRSGLIEQLEYEGFTTSQAEYGVDAAGY